MKLLEYVDLERICLNPPTASKDALFRGLLAPFQAEFGEDALEQAVKNLLRREVTSPTGFGDGVAIPHALVPDDIIKETRIYIGVVPEGIDYNSLDQQPVHVVYLVLSPQSRQRTHVRLLARLARLFRDPALTDRLKRVSSRDDIYRLITREDQEHL